MFSELVVVQSGPIWLEESNEDFGNRNSSSRCGQDSFMMRDGVCDEATNIEACVFDGGDCCLEKKNEDLCHNCVCKMSLDLGFIESKFDEQEVRMFRDDGQFRKFIQMRAKMVTDVENVDTCSMLCLNDGDIKGKINSWFFNFTSQACKCTWINTNIFLTHSDIIGAPVKYKNVSSEAITFIQMSKQFTTGMQTIKHLHLKWTTFASLFPKVANKITCFAPSTDLAVECVEINATYLATKDVKIGTLRNELSPSDCKEACGSAGNCTNFSWNGNGKMVNRHLTLGHLTLAHFDPRTINPSTI